MNTKLKVAHRLQQTSPEAVVEVDLFSKRFDKECSRITCHSRTSTDVDDFSTKEIDREWSLISCHSSSTSSTSIWYVDSEASSHMTGVKKHFTDLTETWLDLEVVLGDNAYVMF